MIKKALKQKNKLYIDISDYCFNNGFELNCYLNEKSEIDTIRITKDKDYKNTMQITTKYNGKNVVYIWSKNGIVTLHRYDNLVLDIIKLLI